MATPRVLPQSKETLLQNYNKRLKDDIKSILENFIEIIKTAKVCWATALLAWFLIFQSVLFALSIVQDNGTLLHYTLCFSPQHFNVKEKENMFFVQIEDETQVSRPTQAEQDHYEMHVRAANIVCIYHNLVRGRY